MIHYVCKYTPVELFRGFGEKCAVLEEMPENCTCKFMRFWKISDPGSPGGESRSACTCKLL